MMLRTTALLALLACKTAPTPTPTPAEECPAPAPTEYDMQLHFTNLGRETVSIHLEGEAAAHAVAPLGTHHTVKRVLNPVQKATVTARNFAADGTPSAVSLPIEFDASTDPVATYVLRDQMPNRISMNVTVPKQTQGATFGERVKSSLEGLDMGGGIDTGGDCAADVGTGTVVARLRDSNPCDDSDAPWFRRPSGVSESATPFFMRGGEGELQVAWVETASLVGGALPGGAIISAAVSSMYVLNAHSDQTPPSLKVDGTTFFDVSSRLSKVPPSALSALFAKDQPAQPDTSMKRSIQVVVGASTQTLELGAVITGPCRPPYLCDFLVGQDLLVVIGEHMTESQSVLKTKHDTAKNSIGNIRGLVVFGTTSTVDTNACILSAATDTTCVMGAARVKAGLEATGSMLQQGTTRFLYPPKWSLGATSPTLTVSEDGGTPFTWKNHSPVFDHSQSGYAILASGQATGGQASQRTMFFVNISTSPWTVTSELSD